MGRMCSWRLTAIGAIGVLLVGLAGCKPSDVGKPVNERPTAERPAMTSPTPPPDPTTLGTVSGTIHFIGPPPERVDRKSVV